MNGIYTDNVLARMIANERTTHREGITLTLGRNPLRSLNNTIQRVYNAMSKQLESKILVPVYCIELALYC